MGNTIPLTVDGLRGTDQYPGRALPRFIWPINYSRSLIQKGITHVLRDLDYSSLSDLVGRQVIGLVFDDKAASSFEGRITLELSINLLSRLYPRIRLMPKGSTADSFGADLVSIAKSINPAIEIDDAALPTAMLVVGEHASENNSPAIYVGSDRWIARTSMSEPLSSATSEIPFGAATAACLGNANLFRVVFQNYLGEATTDRYAALPLSIVKRILI